MTSHGTGLIPRVAFATYRRSPEISDDDRLAADVLARRGVEIEGVVWDAADVDWTRFDRVIVRSTWDFHLQPLLYAQWVRRFFDEPGRLWNPPQVILDNLDKRYLTVLQRGGVAVVPTECVGAGEERPLA